MSNKNYAIVITAYNRAASLKCLLNSLNAAKTFDNVPLIISIDNQGTEAVNKLAEEFRWHHGKKKVIIHPKRLGLREHFIWTGDQTEKYENVLFLEDDLYVSPFVGEYVESVIGSYADDDRVAGGSLYNPLICEFSMCRFYQIEDGYDNYFFQHPYWGNVWMKDKWRSFKKWLETYETSFKKLYIQFLIETNRYIVYPRVSYLTNMGEKGLHSKENYPQFHVTIQNGHRNLKMSKFDDSMSIYDSFFELLPSVIKRANPVLAKYDFTVDIKGLKENYTTEYVLSLRKTRNIEMSFCAEMRPVEEALLIGVDGSGLALTKSTDIIKGNKKVFSRMRKAEDIVNRNYVMDFLDFSALVLYGMKKSWRILDK